MDDTERIVRMGEILERVVILGAGGHGKVIADCITQSGDTVCGFFDDDESIGDTFAGFPVYHKISEYDSVECDSYVIAIGNANTRKRVAESMPGVKWYTCIHPSAVIADDVTIGEGTVVLAGAVINPGASIGKHCIINTSSIVEHDNVLEDYVHVSVGATLTGTVHVGAKTWIGAGAVVINNKNICGDCMIGAGAVVIDDIDTPGTYVGVPAKMVIR